MLHANTSFIIFGLTQSGLESMTYHTESVHTDNYSTNTVSFMFKFEGYVMVRDLAPLSISVLSLEENAVPRVNYLHVQNEPPKEGSGLILW